jgi:uridine kinase
MTSDTVFQILSAIKRRKQDEKPFLIAIDGRCAAGKTTLAAQLQNIVNSNVFHMDDFFLPPGLRTRERLAQPGGNVDYERFRFEILLPALKGGEFSYRPYSCHLQRQTEPVLVQPKSISIIEGSYSCHPYLWDCYDLRIFLNIGREEQLQRIRERNGSEQLNIFQKRWIPLEEQYFSAYQIQQRCDLSF